MAGHRRPRHLRADLPERFTVSAVTPLPAPRAGPPLLGWRGRIRNRGFLHLSYVRQRRVCRGYARVETTHRMKNSGVFNSLSRSLRERANAADAFGDAVFCGSRPARPVRIAAPPRLRRGLRQGAAWADSKLRMFLPTATRRAQRRRGRFALTWQVRRHCACRECARVESTYRNEKQRCWKFRLVREGKCGV